MLAISRACRDGRLSATVAVVVSPLEDAPVALIARDNGIDVAVVSPSDPDYGANLLSVLVERGVTAVCLAGYLRLLPDEVLRAFPRRILNIHPALLPKFGGKGMYGRFVHEAVIAAGETESGCTVHLVSEQYDEGEIVVQRTCPVLPTDTPESLAARVLIEEHLAYVEALTKVLVGA